jgi:hypothetical protein
LGSGAEPEGGTTEQMRQQINAEVKKFSALAKKINLQLD